MFNAGTVVKILIPNVANSGYDYRLTDDANLGDFVQCTVMNHLYTGVVYGIGDSNLPQNKIKNTIQVFHNMGLSVEYLQWISTMSSWTMMSMGAILRLVINVPDAFLPEKTEVLYKFNKDCNVRVTEKRQLVADAFDSNDSEAMSISDIQNIAHVGPAVIQGMIKNQLLIPSDNRIKQTNNFIYTYSDVGDITLNTEQKQAAEAIKHAVDNDSFDVFLLDGVTGSGKTQVYFDAVWHAYQHGGSVLLMMPEIALTTQFMERFRQRFGAPAVVWHSNLTSARRREIWRGVASGKIRIVVGTRSALFLPWQNLKFVVVDEEHDSSYKQEDMGNYHARDMAVLRAKLAKFPIVLASATPSEETVYNVQKGKYKYLKLTARFGGACLPDMKIIDLKSDKPLAYKFSDKDFSGNLSQTLCDEIARNLEQKQQILLFINRRGFAPIIQCRKCGWVATCSDCSVGMTYHKKTNKLLCHMCGRIAKLPEKCPQCDSPISMLGTGLEQIAQEVSVKFPNAKIELVSSDTMMTRQALERLVQKMENKEIDILIGTQILSKGHHFPNLTLVGVIDSDMGLYGTDFRAFEHTFQQLFQVSGRAGRAELKGRVLLQTYQPDHPVLRAICDGDRDGFIKTDMQARSIAKMPPFGQLIAIIIEAQKESILKTYCENLRLHAPNLLNGKIMGPIPSQIYQIRNWYRMRFLVAGDERANLQPIVQKWIQCVKQPVNTKVKIDVSPQNFM